ncbi:PAC2 family protein [Agromyces archimandritae]|uniref:PAC2 family protein n=1 Tax=Agromyces archimandritae TaxID=2781962 RepID=A0A975INZ8_9MICO|nr:PAC2 family protein [Agromyces archimandritae]QTX04759.1 PAC2 family protein [Agromyces archimandritae]
MPGTTGPGKDPGVDQSGGFGGGRLLVVAFEGWNDAGEAASGAARALIERLDLDEVASIDPELYFDYQFTRPMVETVDGRRRLNWPGAKLLGPKPASGETPQAVTGPGAEELHILVGQEPARSWKAFAQELVDAALTAGIDGMIMLGAMLADAPHTRPLTVFASSDNDEVRQSLGLERSTYEGPVGILTVLSDAAEEAGIPTVTLWGSVPHYIHQSPSPKAVLALLGKLEQLTGLTISRGDLEEEAAGWEAGVDAIAADDEEMGDYIRQLEQARDTADSPQASGDAIAQEFEQYLRRRGDGGTAGEPWRGPQPGS